jgi:glyceraldehyde-3-phosphate dehydrogenase (NAD(P))
MASPLRSPSAATASSASASPTPYASRTTWPSPAFADVVTDYRVQTAVELDVPLVGATEEAVVAMREVGLRPARTLDDQIADSHFVVDCAPTRNASQNRDRYVAAGRKAIFQGGVRHALTGFSFVAGLN